MGTKTHFSPDCKISWRSWVQSWTSTNTTVPWLLCKCWWLKGPSSISTQTASTAPWFNRCRGDESLKWLRFTWSCPDNAAQGCLEKSLELCLHVGATHLSYFGGGWQCNSEHLYIRMNCSIILKTLLKTSETFIHFMTYKAMYIF